MSATVDIAHSLVTEVVTEISTAEIAAWIICISAVVCAAAPLLARRARRTGNAEAGYAAMQVGALLTVYCLFAVHARTHGWLTSSDSAVTDWFVAHRSSTLTAIARGVTDMGSPAVVVVVALAASAALGYRRRSLLPALIVVATVAVASAASTLTKIAVARSRPPVEVHLVAESDYSFPSGHVTGTVALLGALLVVTAGRRYRARAVLVVAAVALVVLIAASRLYLGVHWVSDVVAGVLLGAAAVTAAAAIYGRIAPRELDPAAPTASAEPPPAEDTVTPTSPAPPPPSTTAACCPTVHR